jgi:hypothetical protein
MYPRRWERRAGEAVLLLLAIAFGAHMIWSWLAPLVPAVFALVVLGVVYAVMFGRRR